MVWHLLSAEVIQWNADQCSVVSVLDVLVVMAQVLPTDYHVLFLAPDKPGSFTCTPLNNASLILLFFDPFHEMLLACCIGCTQLDRCYPAMFASLYPHRRGQAVIAMWYSYAWGYVKSMYGVPAYIAPRLCKATACLSLLTVHHEWGFHGSYSR